MKESAGIRSEVGHEDDARPSHMDGVFESTLH